MPKRRKAKKTLPAKTRSKPAGSNKGWESPIVVVFVDIVGCSEISNHEQINGYNDIVGQFQQLFKKVCNGYQEDFYQPRDRIHFKKDTRGDEGCLMIFRTDGEPVKTKADLWADDIDTAITIALELKRGWLLSKYNKERIASGKLPADLAIGVHFGKAWINPLGNDNYQPEGYAINLTKRIEGNSRDGMFTHIDVSEAAHDKLYVLTDEVTYTFAKPRPISTKGISQGINVFEVKHHFLPTDWTDEDAEASKWRYYKPSKSDLETAKDAHEANPTNLWVAEEYIMLVIQQGHDRLKESQREDMKKLKKAYEKAETLSKKLSTSHLRDAASLAITGFIVGEYKNYAEEQHLYKEAKKLDALYAEAYWYLGYSMSMELYEKLGEQGPSGTTFQGLEEEDRKTVQLILKHYRRAIELKPWHVWMKYDLGCELWRWGKKQEAIGILQTVLHDDYRLCNLLDKEPYLEGILEETRMQKTIKAMPE